jgi:hypothetical protein
MFCPSCGAEYRSGFDTCSDCGVALVEELPQQSSLEKPGTQAGAVLVWSGNDVTRHAQARSILERAGLSPYTVSHQDRLFGTSERPQFEVYIAPESADKAKEALAEPMLSAEAWDQLQQSGALELPAEDGPDDERSSRSNDWNPEDAIAEIWSGADTDLAEMIVASLGENQIDCRREAVPASGKDTESTTGVERVLVLPEDEIRGKDIVREIIDATPL